MEEQTFLIFGSNGWIGNKVCCYLDENNISYYKAVSRADDIDKINKELLYYPKITNIICLIGRTHGIYNGDKITTIDYLEKPGKLVDNIRDNLFSPVSLALLCNEKNIHLTYLGTGCIFDSDTHTEENGFTEESKPNFFGSSYSIVKGFTDRLMHKLNVLNVRIRMPITDEINERNFITKITSYKKICSIPNSMSVLNELIPIMIDMSQKKEIGTINLTNPGIISHNEILEMYKEIVDNGFTWENFTIAEQDQILLSKRSNNYLDTTVLQSKYPNVKNIKDSVKEMLISMKKNNNTV